MGYISRKDERPVGQFVADLMDLYGINENASMETVECFKFEIMSVCNMAVINQSYPLEDQTQLGRLLESLREREREYEEKGDFCKQTYEYIKERYGNPDLSLSMLSDRVGISAAYLSLGIHKCAGNSGFAFYSFETGYPPGALPRTPRKTVRTLWQQRRSLGKL